jgi:hypothetical protein
MASRYASVSRSGQITLNDINAGDAAKSLRFFKRAIEVYTQGLCKFPRNLDLAYNKYLSTHG